MSDEKQPDWDQFRDKGTRYASRATPSVTVSMHGHIRWNARAIEKYTPEEEPNAVRFFTSADPPLVGFQFRAQQEEHDYAVNNKSAACKSVLNHLGLRPPVETLMIEIEEANGMPCIPLGPVIEHQPDD